jgi:endoglucanase
LAKSPTVGEASSPTRRNVLKGAATVALGALALPCAVPLAAYAKRKSGIYLRGVALAGAEFGQLVPGQVDRDYFYPTAADFRFCRAQAFNTVRLPFRWERLQPDLNAPFDPQEWGLLKSAIRNAREFGLKLILDPHNYAHRRVRDDDFTVDHLIGSPAVPSSAFSAFWSQLAKRTAKDAHVIYGIMNEPEGLSADAWLDTANEAIAAIRRQNTGTLLLVPGTAYSGAHSWIAAGNTALARVRDSAGNFAIEVHQYLDADSSGTSGAVVSETIGVERLQNFQAWARAQKFKAFLGEFGAASDAASLAAMSAMLREVERNSDVWIGWTAWATGAHWPQTEPFRLAPGTDGVVPPQTKFLASLARAAR